jgi:hypothetical protein
MRSRVAAAIIGLVAASTVAAAQDSAQKRGAMRGAGHKEFSRHAREAAVRQASDTAAARPSFPDSVGWRLIEDTSTGAHVGLPEKLVPRTGSSRTGSRWTSAQGQVQIETFRLTEAALPALFEQEKKALRRQIVSSALKADSFVITGVQGLKNFLVRADVHGTEVRGVTVLYDQATEGTMESIGRAVVDTFAAFPNLSASSLPVARRMVEYATAIVVSTDGDLIVPAHVTDDCQVIAVPGLGHVERVAVDQASDLALLRLYGARDLVPAAFAGETGKSGDLTLIGIADPLAQAGAAEVSKTTARLNGHALEPAPKLGFAGAAALDSRGALAGMVNLKAPVVAGGATSQVATVVPADAIRAFLQVQGVAPAAAGASVDQSVLRIVCVRK